MKKDNYTEMIETFGDQFVCPLCEFEYVHFEEPKYVDGKDNYEAWSGKGDAIIIPMWCENSHGWDLIVGFHKGGTFFKIDKLGNLTKEEAASYMLDDGTNK